MTPGSRVQATDNHLEDRVQSIVIVGGGAAGWLAAATLARLLKPGFCAIRVIDSPPREAGPLSEVALPSFHRLNNLLGIDENDLLQRTRGTFKLGTHFVDWGSPGDGYFHSFGSLGAKLEAVPFHHYWIKLRQLGDPTGVDAYSTATVAAQQGRFAHPLLDRRSVLSLYSYGYHFCSKLLAAYLQEYALAHGVGRVAREIVGVELRSADGFIDALTLDDGSLVRADLYIDCSGPRGVLSRHAFTAGYEDWSHWLPCDRMVSIPCANSGDVPPCSQSIAEPSGWRRRIPLQHCVDDSYAYSSRYVSDDEACATLVADLRGGALAEPRFLPLSPGRPKHFWHKNCIAIAGAIPEPLESTSLHLVQTGVTRLVTLFPVRLFSPDDITEYNRLTTIEHERIRDFLILHYKTAGRSGSPFWDDCRHMAIPDRLRGKIELFERCGRIAMFDDEHFSEDSWLCLFLGQNVDPQDYDPLADVLDVAEVRAALLRMRTMIQHGVATMPTHTRFIAENCQAPFKGMP
jgi:tryptophan halogenase